LLLRIVRSAAAELMSSGTSANRKMAKPRAAGKAAAIVHTRARIDPRLEKLLTRTA